MIQQVLEGVVWLVATVANQSIQTALDGEEWKALLKSKLMSMTKAMLPMLG